MEQWDQDFVDMVSPGQITFTRGGRGEFHFGAVDVTLDWRVNDAGSRVEFSLKASTKGMKYPAEAGHGWTAEK